MAKLTAIGVGNLKPKAHVYEHMDQGSPGFGVRVHPSGAKAYIYRYRFQGRLRRLTLGPIPGTKLKDARARYEEQRARLRQNIDPLRERQERLQEQQQSSTVAALVDIYLRRHAVNKRSGKEDQRILERDVLPAWGNWRAKDVRKRDVVALLDMIVDRGAPIQANRTLACVRKVFNFAVEKDLLEASPCMGIKAPGAECVKDRVLSDDEIRSFWRLSTLSHRMRALLRLQLLLAQRVGEVAGMRWSEVDFAARTWTLPAERAKNATVHVVPLTEGALQILNEMYLLRDDSDFVFPSSAGGHVRVDTVVTALRRAVGARNQSDGAESNEATGLAAFSSHDLRRTAATRISGMQVSREVLRQILNHRDRSVTARYDRYRYEPEKRAALEAWGRELRRIVEGEVG
jgi:integrase